MVKVAFLVITAAIVVMAALVLGVEGAGTLWLLAIYILAAGIGCAAIRYSSWGMGDPLFLFAAIFIAYNASVLTEVAILASLGNQYFFYIIGYFSVADLANAGAASSLAATGLLIAAFVLPRTGSEPKSSRSSIRVTDQPLLKVLFALGFIAVAATMLLISVVVVTTTGVGAFLSASRTGGERFNYSTVFGVGIPTTAFVIAGFSCMLAQLYSRPSRFQTSTFALILAVFLIFNVVQGSRHLIIYIAVMLLGAYATQAGTNKLRIRTVALFALGGYTLFAYIAGVRSILPQLFRGAATLMDLAVASLSFSWEWLFPSRNEFAGPYLTLLDTLAYPQPLQHGMTYLNAVLAILPTRLYPGLKPLTLGSQFAAEISFRIASFGGSGFGFSPVAEAFDNFGYFGIPLVFIVFGAILHFAGKMRSRSLLGFLVYLTLLAQVVNTNRFSLDGTLQELAFSVLIVLSLFVLARIATRIIENNQKPRLELDNPAFPSSVCTGALYTRVQSLQNQPTHIDSAV